MKGFVVLGVYRSTVKNRTRKKTMLISYITEYYIVKEESKHKKINNNFMIFWNAEGPFMLAMTINYLLFLRQKNVSMKN